MSLSGQSDSPFLVTHLSENLLEFLVWRAVGREEIFDIPLPVSLLVVDVLQTLEGTVFLCDTDFLEFLQNRCQFTDLDD